MGVLSVVHALIERQLANDDAALTVNPYRRGCDLVAKSVLDDMHLAFIYDRDLRVRCAEIYPEINRVSRHRRSRLPFRQSPEPSCGVSHRRKWLGSRSL